MITVENFLCWSSITAKLKKSSLLKVLFTNNVLVLKVHFTDKAF